MIPLMPLLSVGLAAQAAPPKLEIGRPAPNVAFTDMSGQRVSLSSFRGRKVILFNWASW